jgi:hypothetical protein
MAKVLVNVKIGDDDNSNYSKVIQVEINSIDYLVIKDCMEFCSGDEYDTSWNRLIQAIERTCSNLPRDWFVNGTIEFAEYVES